MSTSPTLINWRRKSSVRKLSSANSISVRSAVACPYVDARHATSFQDSDSFQPKPVKLIGPHRQQIRNVADTRKHIPAKHLNRNVPLVPAQVQFDSLRGARKIVDHQDRLRSEEHTSELQSLR